MAGGECGICHSVGLPGHQRSSPRALEGWLFALPVPTRRPGRERKRGKVVVRLGGYSVGGLASYWKFGRLLQAQRWLCIH
jgi:hypothetical protein